MTEREYNGWMISFRRNIHMYCHDLRASKDGATYQISCEDSPLSAGLIAMWPYDVEIEVTAYHSLIQSLHDWATNEGLTYRIYVSRDRFEPDDSLDEKHVNKRMRP